MATKRSARSKDVQHKKFTLIVLACVAAAAALAFAVVYSDYLGARVAPGLRFGKIGPSVLTAGEKATITWDTSTEGAKQYPYEKIEACWGKKPKVRCVVLASIVANNGRAVVKVPASLPAGGGQLKLTARDANKMLVGSRVSTRGVSIRKAKSVVATNDDSNGGGSSGGNGGSSGGTGGGSTQQASTPTADILDPLDNEQIILNDTVDVRAQLAGTDASKLACQEWILDGVRMTSSQWQAGQAPVLSTTACQ